MLENNIIITSLSDYVNYFKQKVHESLNKEYNNNNLTEIILNTQPCNDKLNSSIEIDINKSNKNENNSNQLLCSIPTISKNKFNTQNETKTLKIDYSKKEFNSTEIIKWPDNDSMNTFPKCGRIPNILKNIKKGKHDNKAKDNSRIKLFNLCAHSLDDFIRNEFKKYKISLHCLNIKSQLGTSLDDFDKFFDKKIIQIYFDSSPKRKTESNIDYNKNQIQLVLEKELKNNGIKIKILNIIFNIEFRKIFKMFLYDIPYIILSNNNNENYKISLIGFKTYKYYLEELDDDIKEQIKNDVKLFLKGEIKHRKLRKERNNDL